MDLVRKQSAFLSPPDLISPKPTFTGEIAANKHKVLMDVEAMSLVM